MDFLKKAQKSLEEVQGGLTKEFKSLNFGKKNDGAAPAASERGSVAGPASTITTQSDTTSTPVLTPATTISQDPSEVKVPHCTAAGAPSKIPLAGRKKIRDDFEAKKPELEKEFSKILGAAWSIHVDTAGVYTYMANDSRAIENPGFFIHDYFEGALRNLQRFAEKYSAGDVTRIAELAPSHVITLEPTFDDKVRYIDTDFLEGRWRLLFRDINFGINTQSTGENLDAVLNAASKTGGASGRPEMSLIAKKGIRDGYDSQVAPVLARAHKLLNNPGLAFDPNWEANYAALAAFDATLDREEHEDNSKLRNDWEDTLGPGTLAYFQGFVSQLEWKKFNKDDMMQEAFSEAVSSNSVAFIVTKDITRLRNDCTIEDGILKIRTNELNWWANPSDACDKLDELM